MAISGSTIACAAGTLTQPVATGAQTVSLGINAAAVLFLSIRTTSTSVQSPEAQLVLGWANGTNQHGFWSGEKRNGNTSPIYGARYLSDSTVLGFGTPDGASTTFASVAAVTDLSRRGHVTLDWSAVDGTAREILWFAVGGPTDYTPDPAPPSAPCCCSCDDTGGATTPSGNPSTSATGPILPPVDQTAWTPMCTGGGTVPSAPDATDSESWVS